MSEIVRDKNINFNRPRLLNSGVGTDAIEQRYKTGESVSAIAEDYGISELDVECAHRFEGLASVIGIPDALLQWNAIPVNHPAYRAK